MASRRQDVRVWSVQDRRENARNNRGWIVRWVVDGKTFSRSFRTRALADRFRSELVVAHDNGDRFDAATGEPLEWSPTAGDASVYDWSRRWVAEQWDEWQPRTRASAIEALARFVPLAVRDRAPDAPEGLRQFVAATLDPSTAVADGDPFARWLARWSTPLSELNRERLAAVEAALVKSLDGRPLSPSTAGRYRKVARACIRRAVDLSVIPADPWPPPSRGRRQRKVARASRAFDVRQLPDPATMRSAIEAIASARRRRTGLARGIGRCGRSVIRHCACTTAVMPPPRPGCKPACPWVRRRVDSATASKRWCRHTSAHSPATRKWLTGRLRHV